MYIYDFIQGLIIGGTLIIAIGPQNLFVIQQGLKKSYVFTVTLFCSLSAVSYTHLTLPTTPYV